MGIQNQKRVSRLIVLHIQRKLNEEQERELNQWRSDSEAHEALFQKMLSGGYWEESVRRFVKSDVESNAEWRSIRRQTLGARSMVWKNAMRYAALLILFLGVSGGLFYIVKNAGKPEEVTLLAFTPGRSSAVLELPDGRCVDLKDVASKGNAKGMNWSVAQDSLKYQPLPEEGKEVYHTLRVPRGGEYTLILSDGTKVFLNAESRLKYPVNFVGDCRKVKLEGEAYFEVRHDAGRTFIVEAGQLKVKVLGTSFGVKAYTDEADVRMTLVSGRVNVSAGDREYEVKPSQQAVYDRHSNNMKIESVDTELFVGWKNGRLVFDNCPLEMILAVLGRWYSFEVSYAGEDVKEIPFSLNVRKYDKIEQVLELMQNTGKIRFEHKGNTIIVR